MVIMCPPLFGMEGRNGMVNTVEKEGRDGGHAKKIGMYPNCRGSGGGGGNGGAKVESGTGWGCLSVARFFFVF